MPRTTCTAASAFLVAALSLLLPQAAAVGPLSSSKRGLVFTPNEEYPQDNYVWRREPSDLTWYYNYEPTPSVALTNWTQAQFEFVPQMWGAPADVSDTSFKDTVTKLIKGGRNISHVLAFNEPDLIMYGGSNVDPRVGAQVWVNNFEPLREMGLRVGLPACSGGYGGLPWLRQFLGNCSEFISAAKGSKQNCTYDFVPIHWYGNFDGLASHIGEYSAEFNKSMWVTEYNFDNQDLASTQAFYNISAEYFDRLDNIERYSLFGAFRSSKSNVGANAAMLNNGGSLTDIGAWYLGRQGTGVAPTSAAPSLRSSPVAGVVVAAMAVAVTLLRL